jgi:hypothetical protein
MNWILALTIFFIGFGLGRSIKFLKSISVSMKTVLIAQFQSLLMVLKSTEHINFENVGGKDCRRY